MEIYAVADLRASFLSRTTEANAENRCSRTTETAIDIYFWLLAVFFSFLIKFAGSNLHILSI
jgi:hypothetical protein